MARQAMMARAAADDFTRLHRMFVEHMGYAVILTWAATAWAAWSAPWVRNLRGLIDPLGRAESTASYLFALPGIMTIALILVAAGGDRMRRLQLMKNQSVEFGIAGVVVFAVFCLALDRAVTVFLLAHQG